MEPAMLAMATRACDVCVLARFLRLPQSMGVLLTADGAIWSQVWLKYWVRPVMQARSSIPPIRACRSTVDVNHPLGQSFSGSDCQDFFERSVNATRSVLSGTAFCCAWQSSCTMQSQK